MRNNRHIKMLAWIMVAVMLLCAMPLAASDGIQINAKPYAFVINYNAYSTSKIQLEGGVDANLKQIDADAEYFLHLSVEKKDNSLFPDGEFYYELPVEVESATGGSQDIVTWRVVENNSRMLAFTSQKGKDTERFTVDIPVTLKTNTYDLYNLVEIKRNNATTYYRLAKTRIKCNIEVSNVEQLVGHKFVDGEYEVNDYSFETLDIVLDGKTYVYADDDFKQDPDNPMAYYTVEAPTISVVRNKIGGMTNGKENWLVPMSQRYNDLNNTTGFHRDYKVTLHDAPIYQTLYNMVGVNKDKNYYRLKTTQILASPAEKFSNNYNPKTDEYVMIPGTQYDFSGVVITVDGVEYRYRATAPASSEKEYDNYYTISWDGVRVKTKMHESGGDAWFTNPAGFLDGASYDASVTNDTISYHADYKATTHKGKGTFYSVDLYDGSQKIKTVRTLNGKAAELTTPTKEGYTFAGWKTADGEAFDISTAISGNIELYAAWTEGAGGERKIDIVSDWPSDIPAYVGTRITLTAILTGYDGLVIDKDYRLQWQYTTDQVNWNNIEDANGITYVFVLDRINTHYTWRVIETE